jgi:hypothetical protein
MKSSKRKVQDKNPLSASTEMGGQISRAEKKKRRKTHKLKSAKEGTCEREREENNRAKGTHDLETAKGGTCQDTERIRPSDTHSRPGDTRATCQDTEWVRPSDVHSPTGDGRGRDLSGHKKNPTEQHHSLPGDGRRRDLSGHGNKPTKRRTLTSWRQQRNELVRTRNENDRAMCTHFLETGTCQDTQRNRPSGVYSLSGDNRGRNLSGHRKKPTEQRSLTLWRQQRDGLVRTLKETDQATCTHQLETAERGTCRDTKRNRRSNAHSPTGDRGERDLSGHREKPTERRALTN